MTAQELPKFPPPLTFTGVLSRDYMIQLLEHDNALIAFWESRARLAVEALQSIVCNSQSGFETRCADEALAKIGPLPSQERTP